MFRRILGIFLVSFLAPALAFAESAASASSMGLRFRLRRVSDIISEIASASAEQGSGIEQISVAITQMDPVTQQNASLVEEASKAADSLQQQAAALTEVVGVFKLGNSVALAPARPALPLRRAAAATAT